MLDVIAKQPELPEEFCGRLMSKRLRWARVRHGSATLDVVRSTGVNARDVFRAESATLACNVAMKTVHSLAQHYKCSADYLLGLSNSKVPVEMHWLRPFNGLAIAERCREVRALSGQSVMQFAQAIDCTVTRVVASEASSHTLRCYRAGELFAISKLSNSSVDWLLRFHDYRQA